MASLKDLFNNPVSNIVSEKKVLETGYFENIDEVFELTKANNRYLSQTDFSNPANFAKFGSAVKYYTDAIDYINQTYPHNKSGLEKQTWENKLSDLEYYIYKNEYPRTTGYFSSSNGSYINIVPNIPQADTLKNTFENSTKSVYGSNLHLDYKTGFTVEFWLNPTSENNTLLHLSTSNSELKINLLTNNFIFNSYNTGISQTKNSWNHYAFVVSGTNLNFYLNGTWKENKTITTTIEGNVLNGSLFNAVAGGSLYNAKLDEFRIWNTPRTAKQIGRFWKTHVNGNSATDKTLSVYYKFNEGISTNIDANKLVEDYSGRNNYGVAVSSNILNCRFTGSGMDQSGLSQDQEQKDLILYSPSNNQLLSDYYEQKLELAKEYDSTNYQKLYNTLPSWMIEEEQKDDTKHMENFMQIISVYFDELLNKSLDIKNYKNAQYTSSGSIVPFYNKILSSTGFDVADILTNADFAENLLNKTDTNILDDDLTRVKNIIYQNIYNNLSFILKSKGTEKSIKNLLRSFGINENLVKVNLYGDNVEYTLKDTHNSTSVIKKILSLSASNSINSVENIASSSNPLTFEVLGSFDSLRKSNDSKISLFGVDDLRVFYNKDTDSKGSFQLTSSVSSINLTSSAVYELYNNSKWLFAIKIASGSVGLYGVNTVADQSVSEFDLYSTSSYDFLSKNKSFYVGATGSYNTDYNVFSVKAWDDLLDNNELFYHSKDIENYGRKYFSQYSGSVKNVEKLLVNWNFDTITGSNGLGQFQVSDEKSFNNHTGLGKNFALNSSNFLEKLPVQTMKQSLPETLNSSDMINILSEDDAAFYGTGKKPEQYYLAFENSMYQQISDEMLKFAASIVDFNNLIGEPKYKFTQEYQTLNELKQLFFKNIGNVPSLEKYINLYKWLDSSLGMMLEQLRPATARGTIGLKPVVENHVFSRNKVQHTLPYFKEKIVDLSTHITNPNDNKGVHASGMKINNPVPHSKTAVNSIQGSEIDVVSIENIRNTNYFNNYEIVQTMKDTENTNQNKSVFQSRFSRTRESSDTKVELDYKDSLNNGLNESKIFKLSIQRIISDKRTVGTIKKSDLGELNKINFAKPFTLKYDVYKSTNLVAKAGQKSIVAYGTNSTDLNIVWYEENVPASTYFQENVPAYFGINDNTSFSRNIPYLDINYVKSASTAIGVFDYQSIPSGSVLENRYNNNLLGYTEPPVEWTLPSYNKLQVSTALEPIEIYSPYSSLRDSFANLDLWNYLNKTGDSNLFITDSRSGSVLYYGAEALDKRDKVFLDTVYQIPNIDILESYHRDIVFPLKSNMGLNIIRNKPDYEEVAGTGSNGYDRNTAEIRSFWNSDANKRLRTIPTLSNPTGSYNLFGFPNLKPQYSAIVLKSSDIYNIFSGSTDLLFFKSASLKINPYYIAGSSLYLKSIYELEKSRINDISIYGGGSTPHVYITYDNNAYNSSHTKIGDLSPISEINHVIYVSKNQIFEGNFQPIEPKPQFIFNNFFGMTTKNLDIKAYLNPPSPPTFKTFFTASLLINNSYQQYYSYDNFLPSYNTYKDFSNNIRPKSQHYSTLPEYILSNNRDYLTSSIMRTDGKSLVGFDDNIRDIKKTNYQINFSNLLKNTDNKTKLTLNVVKKLLPYSGFYPSSRTVQIASEFSRSYSLGTLSGTSGSTAVQKVQTLIQPLFSPGILFNTIKAGIAVDYPIYVSSSNAPYTDFYSYDNYNDEKSSVKKYSNRLPFEAILEPEKLLGLSNNNNTWLYYLDPTRYSNLFSSSYGDNRFYPAIDLTSGKKIINKLYKQSINNFLAEVPNFFLENKLFTYFVSKPETEWQKADDNKIYKMRIKLEQSKNFSMFSTGSGNVIPIESLFGPPSYIYWGGTERSGLFSPDAYLPFTPSYMKRWRENFVSNPDFNNQNFIELTYNGNGMKPSITEIKSGSGDSSVRITKYWTTEGNTDTSPEPIINTTYYHHMNVDSSLNLFGKVKSKIITTDSVTGQDLTTEDNPDSPSRWVIQTKFETPLINYKDTKEESVDKEYGNLNDSTVILSDNAGTQYTYTGQQYQFNTNESSVNGIWNRIGTIPEDNNSIQISLTDEGITFNNQTGSLLELCGFEKQTKSIGRIADKKVISEAVLMLPYKVANVRLLSSDAKSKLVKIDKTNKILKDAWGIKIAKQTINDLLKVSDYTKIKPRFGTGRHPKDETIQEIKKILDTNKTIDKNNSIVQLMINMVNYNVPPYLNWLYDTRIEPFVMYIAEFNHELSQQDLANIWQGTLPEIGTIPEEQTVSLDYPIKDGELLNKEMVEYVKNSNFKAEIFKIKKRANTDYKKDATLDETDDISKDPIPWYTFNWPYDHFSLVELINIESESGFKKE